MSSSEYILLACFIAEVQKLESQILGEPSLKNIATLITVKKYLEERIAHLKKGIE
jgi:hypothetical protein